MKKIQALTALFLLFSLSLMAADFSPFNKKPMISSDSSGIAINGYDTVAYFDQDKAIKGEKKFTCEYKGSTWHFSSEENRKRFLENPEKFAPQYGGYCAHALAENKLVESNPKAFVIKDDKLYLYSKKKFRKKADILFKKQTAVREQNWLQLNKSF